MHNYLNSINSKIKFTLEVENDNKTINFLDLTIMNKNQRHEFKVYRKPTHTNHTIHCTSNHPYKYKTAAYSHMIHRLNIVPMNKNDYVEEVNTIKHIADKNGFKPGIVDKMNAKHIRKKRIQEETTLGTIQEEEIKYISVNYNEKTSNAVNKVLQRQGYRAAYRTTNRLQQALNTNENKAENTGVYKLTCDNCQDIYIGQTGRSFATRFNEHTKEIGRPNTKMKSNYAEHITQKQHNYTGFNQNLQIIHKLRKGPMMDRLEELEIYRNKDNGNLMNDKINHKNNNIYDIIIKETNASRTGKRRY